jgi:predicted ArsR family transcriptional regulator
MPQQTRQRIVHILEERETASARELSRLLNVTSANIRHHLSVLIEQGSVKIARYKEQPSRGRPSAVYTLVRSTLRDNLDLLSSILLQKYKDEAPISAQDDELRWLAQRLAAQYPLSPLNPTQRLYSAIQALNRLNYHAQWEAHAESPRIMFGHCPYATILEDHPEMCQVDTYLVEYLTGDPAKLIAKRIPTPEGHRQCVFRIIKK